MAKVNGIEKMSYAELICAFAGVRVERVLLEKQFNRLNSRNTTSHELRRTRSNILPGLLSEPCHRIPRGPR